MNKYRVVDNQKGYKPDGHVVDDEATNRLCYSVRLLQPYARLLAQYDAFEGSSLKDLLPLDPDERVPITVAHELLVAIIEWTGDANFGLKAGRSVSLGDIGVLDYAMSSAATVREAVDVAVRYIHLVNEALTIRVEIDNDRATIRLNSLVALPRAAEDFMVASLFHSHFSRFLSGIQNLGCWFSYAAPNETGEYERTFRNANLRFDAPFCGFVFDEAYLERPLESADPNLHAVLLKYAEKAITEQPQVDNFAEKVRDLSKNYLETSSSTSSALSVQSVIRKHIALAFAELPKGKNLTDKTRNLIAEELYHGRPTAARVAAQLHMSPRTLGRKLESEGTTFSTLLDDLRQRLAKRFVAIPDLEFSEVAFLLGFSDTSVFHRAFKRWTGQTPLEYRRQQQH